MNPRKTVLVLAACAFTSGFSIRAVDPIVPLIAGEFGVALTAATGLVTAFSVAYAVGQPIFGPLGDMFGKAALIVLCGAVLALAVFSCAFAPSLASLIIARGLSGFLAGAIIPVAVALISDLLAHEERQIGLARFLIAPILGQMLGAAASGAVAEWIGWRAVFVLTSALVALSTLAAFILIGAARSGSGETFGPGSIARRYRRVFGNRKAFRLYPLVFIGGAATFGVFPLVSAIFAARSDAGALEAGIVLAGFGIGGVLFGALIRPVLRLAGPKRLGIVGGAVAGASLAAFAIPLHWGLDATLFVVLGFFYYMMHNTIQNQVTHLAPEATGSAMSVFALCMFTAQGVGPLLFGLGFGLLPQEAVLSAAGLLIAGVGIAGARLLDWRDADRPGS